VIIRSSRVVLPDGVRPATIHVHDGRITRVDEGGTGDLVISPGIVDTHVHVNEPGRTEWEGFDTATRAAAAGGVTTIVDMPLNSIPATTTVRALEAKRAAARGQCHVDVAFWGGVVPGNAGELDALIDAGVRGFKCFLVPSGVDEFANVDERDLRAAMPILAKRRAPLLVHAEAPELIADRGMRTADYASYAATRPPEAEAQAIRMVARLATEFGTRVHIVHVASAQAADEVARAKSHGVPITAETCPHYLTFAAEDIPDGATEFKCAPPIRAAHHRLALWHALEAGTLDLIASDHSPAPLTLKCPGDFMKAWGGIASLELGLAATNTGLKSDVSNLSLLARWMSEAPALLAALQTRKGRIAEGLDADLIVWDPAGPRTVDATLLQQRHKLTPYAGRPLRGVVHATFVRGELVWQDGRIARSGSGQLL
jgi:allantoinase